MGVLWGFCHFYLLIYCLALRKKISTVPCPFVCTLALCNSDTAPGGELSPLLSQKSGVFLQHPLSLPCSLPSPPFLRRLQAWRCPPCTGVGGRRAPVMAPAISLSHCTAITGPFWEKPGPPAAQSPAETKQRPFRHAPARTTCSRASPGLIGRNRVGISAPGPCLSCPKPIRSRPAPCGF